jgi:CarD family transcriptional regulator
MLELGTIVVHPSHGKGVLKEIKRMVVLGESSEYYVFDFSANELDTVMIPIDKLKDVGVRAPVERDVLDHALGYLASDEIDVPDPRSNFHRIHKEYTERISKGDILEVAKVFKALFQKGDSRELGLKDKLLFEKTEQLLIGEIEATCKLSPEKSREKLHSHVKIN